MAGVTDTSLGAVTVVGVCIPWSGSRTEVRRKSDRKMRWEDHRQYLVGLTKVLADIFANRTIVMGDFNQIVGPESRAPLELRLALQTAFPPSMRTVTSDLAFQGRRSVDHIALSDDFAVEPPEAISNIHDGKQLSDHFGVVADLSARAFQ